MHFVPDDGDGTGALDALTFEHSLIGREPGARREISLCRSLRGRIERDRDGQTDDDAGSWPTHG
jgi:hypothetical protein